MLCPQVTRRRVSEMPKNFLLAVKRYFFGSTFFSAFLIAFILFVALDLNFRLHISSNFHDHKILKYRYKLYWIFIYKLFNNNSFINLSLRILKAL